MTTAELDRAKSEIYADAGIPFYLLVLPEQKQVILFDTIQDNFYSRKQVFDGGARLAFEGLCSDALDTTELFPG